MVASGGYDHGIIKYHVDGEMLARMSGHSRMVIKLLFSPNNQTLASYAQDRSGACKVNYLATLDITPGMSTPSLSHKTAAASVQLPLTAP